MDNEITTQPEEDTKAPEQAEAPEEVKAEDVVEPAKEDTPEPTIGDVVPKPAEEKKNTKPETVPFEVFEKLKNEVKELKKDKAPSDLDVKELSEKFGADEDLLKGLISAIEDKTLGKFEDKFKSLEEKDQKAAFDIAFKENYQTAIDKMPDYEAIVVPEVIKELSLKKENQSKTFTQLIEDTYGKAVPGRRSVEKTIPGGGQEPQTLDIQKAQNDPAYFKEVMADPTLKAEYNANIEDRINF